MALAFSNRYSGPYVAATSQTNFIADWERLDFDIMVLVDGVEKTNFTINDNLDGFEIVFNAPLLAGQKVEIIGNAIIERTGNFEPFSNYRSEELNREYNELWAISQEFNRDLKRAIKMPFGSSNGQLDSSFENRLLAIENGAVVPADKGGSTATDIKQLLGVAAPAILKSYVSAKEIGMNGNNTGDQSALLETLLNDGREVIIEKPTSAYRLMTPITITKGVKIRGENQNGIKPLFTLGTTDHLFKIRASGFDIDGLDFQCETGTKMTANKAIFLLDTANATGTIQKTRIKNIEGKWLGGIIHDSGGTQAFEDLWLNNITTRVQRGRAINFSRGFASIFAHDCFFERLRNSLYGGETLSEFDYSGIYIDVPVELAGAGGYFFQGVRIAGSNYAGASDKGFEFGSNGAGGSGFRLLDCDVDGAMGAAIQATFVDELQLHLCRISALNGDGLVLDRVTDLNATQMRIDGKDIAGKVGVKLLGQNERIKIDGEISGYSNIIDGNGIANRNIDIQLNPSHGSSINLVADPYFSQTFTSVNDPNDAAITGIIRASTAPTTAGNGVCGRVGFGSVSVIDEPECLARQILRLSVANLLATNPFIDLMLKPLEFYSNLPISLDFWYRDGNGAAYNVTPRLVQKFGTGGSPSADVTVDGIAFTTSGTWKRRSISIKNPSISGKTLGTNNDQNLRARLALPSAQILAFDICKLQLRVGAKIIPLEITNGQVTYT